MLNTRARRRLGAEEGFALMEVVVSAAVLVLVVLGVMAALDAVAGTAGANKARTVAASLAEKDQEELRSLRNAELDNLESLIPAPRTIDVDGVPYTITSDAEWVTDATGEDISCELPSGEGSFIRITSRVTSPMTGARVRPVVMSSIVSPQPGSGTLSAMVKDADGRPVVNMPVQAIQENGSTTTKQTNDAGCAVFGSLAAGSYDVKLDQTGWVDPEGNQAPVQTVTVNAGILSTVEFLYDLKAVINPATVVTSIRSPIATNPPTIQNDQANGVTVAHTGLQTGFRIFNGPATTFDLDRLFPFRDPYKAYAGTCTGADPALYVPTYFDSIALFNERLERGRTYGPLQILEPATNLRVQRGGSNRSNAYIVATPTDESCEGVRITLGPTSSSGTVTQPGLPFGDYSLCAQWTSSGSTWHSPAVAITNRDPAGAPRTTTTPPVTVTPTTLAVSNSSTANGPCP
jgi:type II secretory pathway pseudopilin PulG